jgi:hypothetical protein
MLQMCCPACSRSHQVADGLAGMTLICTGCGQRLAVPARGQVEPDVVLLPVEPDQDEPAVPPPAPVGKAKSPPSRAVPDEPSPVELYFAGEGPSGDAAALWRLGYFPPGTPRREKVLCAVFFIAGWLFAVWALFELYRGAAGQVPQPRPASPSPLPSSGKVLEQTDEYVRQEHVAGHLVLAGVWAVVGLLLQGVRIWRTNRLIDRWETHQLVLRLQPGKTSDLEEGPTPGLVIGAMLGALAGFFGGPLGVAALMSPFGETAVAIGALGGRFLGPLLGGFIAGYLCWGVVAWFTRGRQD